MQVESKFGKIKVARWEATSVTIDLRTRVASIRVDFFAQDRARQPIHTQVFQVNYQEADRELKDVYDNIKSITQARLTAELESESDS